MLSWQRMLYLLCLAVVEATPTAVPLVFAGANGAWGLLILVVLAGALADWLVAVWLPVERQRLALLGIALALALWAIKGQTGGGWGPFAGWGTAFSILFRFQGPQSSLAYLLLLITLYAFRRGTRLLDHDSISLRRFFGRASLALIVILGISFLVTLETSTARLTLTTFMLLTFFAIGLLAIALASAAEEHDTYLSRLGWRGMLTLGGSIGLVLAVGLLLASVAGQDVAQVLGTIARGLLLVVALILLPIMLLLVSAIEWIARQVNLEETLRMLMQQRAQIQEQQAQATEVLAIFPPWAQTALRIFFWLLPILVIVALFLLVRRRARRASDRDEERESLWSWSGLAADVRDMFAGLRRPPADQGLRGVLARLRGADPVSRIRRSYIRLLLAGEARERPRRAPQTPHEYAPEFGALLPATAQPIGALTEAYERARYHPASTSDADADMAERAWGEIDAADRQTT